MEQEKKARSSIRMRGCGKKLKKEQSIKKKGRRRSWNKRKWEGKRPVSRKC